MTDPITVFTARRIHTMDPSLPEATAIAVRDGRIIEVGNLESLQPWLTRHEHRIDDRFAEQVLVPGLIDPHVHPSMMAGLLACEWITGEDWDLPECHVPAVIGAEAFMDRVRDLEAGLPDGEPLVAYGHHPQFHGPIHRSMLDAVSTTRPIIIWPRGYHEFRCNGAALTWLNAEEGAAWDPYIDLESGRMWESGMAWGMRVLNRHLLGGGRIERHLAGIAEMIHRGGVTTVCDAGFGIGGPDRDVATFEALYGDASTPFRLYLIPSVMIFRSLYGDDAQERMATMAADSDGRIRHLHAAKFFADGSFMSQLSQLGEPGFIDGHVGAWMTDPDRLVHEMRPSWEEGRQINVHVTGDGGLQTTLDAIETLLHETPRFDHRTVIQHFALSTQAQVRRLAALGCAVQGNGYYMHQFGDVMVDEWLGTERAGQITRVGSARRNGVSVALHSDLPMGPIKPLLGASLLATRSTSSGRVPAPSECLTPYDAMAAVTIEAAWQLRLDHEIGSLAAGKLADMTVLDADPFEMDPAGWPDIGIPATIRGGQVHEIDAATRT